MRGQKVFALALLVSIGSAGIALADDPTVIWRFNASYLNPLGDLTMDGVTISPDNGFALGIAAEYKFTEKVGVEGGIIYSDIDFTGEAYGISVSAGSATMTPIYVACNFHPLDNDNLDFYLGPMLAYTIWGDLKAYGMSGNLENAVDFGVTIGVDVPLGSSDNWIFNSSLRYLSAGADDGELTVDVDPIYFNVGVGYTF